MSSITTYGRSDALDIGIERKNEEILSMRQSWQREMEDLYQQLSEDQFKTEELRAQLHNYKLARAEYQEQNNDWLIDNSYSQKQEIWRLTQRLHNLQEGSKFVSIQDLNEKREMILGVAEASRDLQSELESLICRHEATAQSQLHAFPTTSDLDMLLKSVFTSMNAKQKMKTCVLKFGTVLLVRVFMLVALREWVFMGAEPDFTPSDNRYLNAYQQEVFNQGGWKQLRALNVAAFDRILRETSYVEKQVPHTANLFASRFSKALAPLFPGYGAGRIFTEFETWGEETGIWKDRRESFRRIFEIGLRLKIKTLKSSRRYEFVVHPPGHKFGGKLPLDTDKNPPVPDERLLHDAYEYATFFIYDTADTSMATALVQLDNFTTRQDNDRTSCTYSRSMLIPRGVDSHPRKQSFPRRGCPAGSALPPRRSVGTSAGDTVLVGAEIEGEKSILPNSSTSLVSHDSQTTDSSFSAASSPDQLGMNGAPIIQKPTLPVVLRIRSQHKKQSSRPVTAELTPDPVNEKDPAPVIQCPKCGRIFGYMCNLNAHVRDGVCRSCGTCGKVVANRKALEKHERDDHGTEASSRTVEKGKHQQRSKRKIPHDAIVIEPPRNKRRKLLPSTQLVPKPPLEDQPTPQKCEKCGREFGSRRDYKQHEKNARCTYCVLCKATFKTFDMLRTHQLCEHESRSRGIRNDGLEHPASRSSVEFMGERRTLPNEPRRSKGTVQDTNTGTGIEATDNMHQGLAFAQRTDRIFKDGKSLAVLIMPGNGGTRDHRMVDVANQDDENDLDGGLDDIHKELYKN